MSLPSVAETAPRAAIQAIRDASAATGVDFAFLLAQAAVESGFDPRAQAASSSARGLFQFVEGTWLAMVRDHGREVGLDRFAGQIGTAPDGSAAVADGALRRKILALRDDPRLSAEFAARLVEENRSAIEARTGREAGATDLYLAHFLGAGDACRFLDALAATPGREAALMFPTAAAANPSVFYAADGTPRSLAAIHASFARKIGEASDTLEARAPAAVEAARVLAGPRAAGFGRPAARPPAFRLDPLVVLVLASLDAPAAAGTTTSRPAVRARPA